jgi:hypothetical protein
VRQNGAYGGRGIRCTRKGSSVGGVGRQGQRVGRELRYRVFMVVDRRALCSILLMENIERGEFTEVASFALDEKVPAEGSGERSEWTDTHFVHSIP